MSGQDTISQDLFSTTRCSNKKQNKTIKIRGSATKELASTEHANFTMKKKIYKRRPHPQPLYTQFSLTRSSPHKSSLSLEDPPEPLKCLATAVQEPPAPSLSALPPLSLFLGSYGAIRRETRTPLNIVRHRTLFKG